MKLTLRFRDQATPKLREMKQQVDAIQKRMDGGRVVSSVDEFRREYGSPEKLIEKIDLGWATSRTLYTRQDYIDAAFDASVFVETVDVQTNPLHAGVVRVLIRGLNGFTTDALLGRVYEYLSAWAPLNVQIEVDLLELESERRDRYSKNWDRLTAALARKNVILDQIGRDALGRRPRSNGIGGFGP